MNNDRNKTNQITRYENTNSTAAFSCAAEALRNAFTFSSFPEIKNVIFNYPATIVLWNDGTKTVVKVSSEEEFDPEKGLAMAIAKKAFGNKGSYFNVIKKYAGTYKE